MQQVKGSSKEKTSTISAAVSKSKAPVSTEASLTSLVPSEDQKPAIEPVIITKK